MTPDQAPYDLEWQATQRGVRGKTLARKGRLDEALALAGEAVALVRQTDMLTTHAIVLTDLAEVLRLAERREEALAALEDALRLFERKGNVVFAAKARRLLAELATGRTD
jgi:tetratricopeptide (TPR) repeat protein